jgi:hypothetical protein
MKIDLNQNNYESKEFSNNLDLNKEELENERYIYIPQSSLNRILFLTASIGLTIISFGFCWMAALLRKDFYDIVWNGYYTIKILNSEESSLPALPQLLSQDVPQKNQKEEIQDEIDNRNPDEISDQKRNNFDETHFDQLKTEDFSDIDEELLEDENLDNSENNIKIDPKENQNNKTDFYDDSDALNFSCINVDEFDEKVNNLSAVIETQKDSKDA